MKRIKLKKITKISNESERYDIQVANTENFFGNDILVHNSWCCMGSHPCVDTPIVTSKGLSEKGLAFKFNDANHNNLYVRAYNATKDEEELNSAIERVAEALGIKLPETPIYLLGEVFGDGVQDLAYSCANPEFRIFDIYIGEPSQGKYLNPLEMGVIAAVAKIKTVPVLYMGSYSTGSVDHFTNGMETISGNGVHMREGIVIKPVMERRTTELGRVMLKSVSEAYILRKGKPTEYS